MKTLDELRYPVGKFQLPEVTDARSIPVHIAVLEAFPTRIRLETESLSDLQLDTPYRENGWTIRQVVHHVADSHINSYCRFKLAMTEENPTIKAYFEDRWAELPEAKSAAVAISLNIIAAIHIRWVMFLKNLSIADYERTFFHPEQKRSISLFQALCIYSWHCNHHLAHITGLKSRMGW